MIPLDEILDRLWQDYARLTPQARTVHDLLRSRGERIINDHVAFRTYDDARTGIDRLAAPFVEHGYGPGAEYAFPEKKLTARYYSHPDATRPKIFISELQLSALSRQFQSLAVGLIDQVSADLRRPDLCLSGRLWKVSYAQYEVLRAESEYGAWVAAFGFRANHFTVSVNALQSFDSLDALNRFLQRHGLRFNAIGGEIKGSPAVLLEQSSTLADETAVEFSDGTHTVPGCYYEFAKRYPTANGSLYEGFVPASADKIFESTYRR